jgi:hypothetical protein
MYRLDGSFWPVVLCCAVVRRKSASLRLVSMRSDNFCVSNNSDVEVIRSLFLVHSVLLARAVCLFLSLSLVLLCRRDKLVAYTHSHALTVKDTGRELSALL